MDAAPTSNDEPIPPTATQWWGRRRLKYNMLLIAAMFLGYVAYVEVVGRYADLLGTTWIDEDGTERREPADTGGIAVIGNCCGAFIAFTAANVCYGLGAIVERWVPAWHVDRYRTWAWRAGVVFSCLLPFSAAGTYLVLCLFFPDAFDQTPVRSP